MNHFFPHFSIVFYLFSDRGRGELFWKIQLDQDLVDTISSIYPEWFRQQQQQQQQQLQQQQQQQNANPLTMQNSNSQQSPPSAEVDESPLQKSMDKNKECEYLPSIIFVTCKVLCV